MVLVGDCLREAGFQISACPRRVFGRIAEKPSIIVRHKSTPPVISRAQ
jgi:hypothetical protein